MKTNNQSDTQAKIYRSAALVHVQFGAPSKHCLHFGICRVSLLKAGQAGSIACLATAMLRRWEDSGLEFTWHKKGMKPETNRRYFAGGVFRVEEACALPGEVAEVLDIQAFTIQPGIYPVLETEQYLKVIFT